MEYAHMQATPPHGKEEPGVMHSPVLIPAGRHYLEGSLALPPEARGIVIFAHGGGSGRHSARNGRIAAALNEHGIATLLADLLTPDEARTDARTHDFRLDIPLLAKRIGDITAWAKAEALTRGLKIAYFGAGTGAAAALVAAARHPDVCAVVLRGGRTDLAADFLPRVQVPVLLVAGGNDMQALQANRDALAALGGRADLHIIPNAGRLFEEPGALDILSQLAAMWFATYIEGYPAPA